MPKISAKMKRIVAEIERADSTRNLFYSRPRIIHRRPSEDTLKRALEQAGVNFDEIKKTNKALGLKRHRDWEKERTPRDAKSNAQALKSLRRIIAERRKAAKRPSVNPLLQTTSVIIDTPFMIKGHPTLGGSHFEAFNSTAFYTTGYTGEINTEDHTAFDSLYFYFIWTNDTGQDAAVSAETPLVVQGHGDVDANSNYTPFDTAEAILVWSAELLIWEAWNKPANLLPPQADQGIEVANISVVAQFPFRNEDRKVVDVFRAYLLAHPGVFVVPRNASVVFQVGLAVASFLQTGGWVRSQFSPPVGFLMCPYVALQVASATFPLRAARR